MADKYVKLYLKRYNDLKNTIKKCGCFLLNASDDKIETYLFEDFDVGVRCDIVEDNMDKFLEMGWIDDEIYKKCIELKEMYNEIDLYYHELRTVDMVRKSEVWLNLFKLSDEISYKFYL